MQAAVFALLAGLDSPAEIMGEELRQQVSALLLDRTFRAALEKETLDVIGQPALEEKALRPERGKDLVYNIRLEVRPVFDLPNYKGLPAAREEVEIGPEEVEKALATLAQRVATPVDAPADATPQGGDILYGVLTCVVEGLPPLVEDAHLLFALERRAAEGQTVLSILGVPGVEDAAFLRGVKIGEKRSTRAVLDKTVAREDMRGKEALIEFELRRIQRQQPAPVDDALAISHGAPDLATLREQVTEQLREAMADETERSVRDQLIEQVVGATSFELPQRTVDAMQESALSASRARMRELGLLDTEGGSRDEILRKGAAEEAVRSTRRALVLSAISKKEGVEVSDDEVDEAIATMARERKKRAAQMYEELEEHGMLEQLKHSLLVRKTVDLLVEHANIKVVPRQRPAPNDGGTTAGADGVPPAADETKPAAAATASGGESKPEAAAGETGPAGAPPA
jgi:trigger factor